ncbi:MAG: SDR family oxidoreductase [Coriobacteriia bacterium]|nr:SDR family oxidoreductase [Coriobacteriia bacterium]
MTGKVAVVTGAGSGIGRSAALRFAEKDASVLVSDISEKAGDETVKLIEEAGGKASFFKADVSDAAQVEAMVKAAIDTYGRLDYAVNNAGIGGEANSTADYSLEGWHKVIGINLNGVFYGLKYEIPAMLESGGGSIVNVASILGLVGFAQSPAYVTAKHGVMGLTKAAAIEYAQAGIRVNAINPGFIETQLLTDAGITPGSDLYAFLASKHAMNRLGQPDEIGKMIVMLCSDEASFVTGIPFPVDGGYTAQ